jgi:Na+-transporting NADH:ubiquinone oxidoreductase subunit NqrD
MDEGQPINDQGWRIFFAILGLVFNGICIAWCMVYGKSDNLLHQNIISWAYISGLGIMGGVGFGQLAPLAAALLTRK